MLSKDSKIYIAGHHGLVGSAIWNNLKARGYNNLVGRSHKELDLTDQQAVTRFFDTERPEAVVLAAAFVGGIMANSLYHAKHEDAVQCNRKCLQTWCQKTPLFRFNVHLSQERTPTHERRQPTHLPLRIYQRGICHSQDSRIKDVRIVQSAIRHQLYSRNAHQPLWSQR